MNSLSPTSTKRFVLPSGRTINVPMRHLELKQWRGTKISDTYGGKIIIDADGKPVFAELAVLRILEKDGWRGVWVDSYGRKFRRGLPKEVAPIDLPKAAQDLFNKIQKKAKQRGGCWDIFAWKGKDYLFAELKRKSRDAIRPTQINWLAAALSTGLKPRSFLLVEWDVI